jgi:hypothetical protein
LSSAGNNSKEKYKQNKPLRKFRSCLHIGSGKAANRFQQSSSQTSNITTRHINQSKTKQTITKATPARVSTEIPAQGSCKVAASFPQGPSKFSAQFQQGSNRVLAGFQQSFSRVPGCQESSSSVPVFRAMHFLAPLSAEIETQQNRCWELFLTFGQQNITIRTLRFSLEKPVGMWHNHGGFSKPDKISGW